MQDSAPANPLGGPSPPRSSQLQWTNLTPFPCQRDIPVLVEALGLSKRLGNVQDRVIFFRPNVRRKCPNGIMTERVVFITPNGLLHLCDNDAAPKRTLALTELLSVVTDSVSQIALITDWPLVLRFDQPKFAASLPMQLASLKQLVSLVKFFRPNAPILRCTTDDFSTVNLNLGKPRQFRAPANFDVLAPPSDNRHLLQDEDEEEKQQQAAEQQRKKSTTTNEDDDDQQANSLTKNALASPNKNEEKKGFFSKAGGFFGKGSSPTNKQQQQSGSGGGTPNSPGRTSARSVQFSAAAPQVGDALPGETNTHFGRSYHNIQQQQQQSPSSPSAAAAAGNSPGSGGSPAKLRRPDAPKGPTDFWAAQQNALYEQYSKQGNLGMFGAQGGDTGNNNNNNFSEGGDLPKTKIDPKVDKMWKRPGDELNQYADNDNAVPVSEEELAIARGEIPPPPPVVPTENQQQQRTNIVLPPAMKESSAASASAVGPTSPTSGKSAYGSSASYVSNAKKQLQQQSEPFTGNNNELGAYGENMYAGGNFDQQQHQQQYQLQQQQQQQLQAQEEYNIMSDAYYFSQLPHEFPGKTSNEVRIGIEVVERIERVNEDLRREVLMLQMREKHLKAAPIPHGRVVPAEAAMKGAAVRNLGVIITSICRRQKLLTSYHNMQSAQESLLRESANIAGEDNINDNANVSGATNPRNPMSPAISHDDI